MTLALGIVVAPATGWAGSPGGDDLEPTLMVVELYVASHEYAKTSEYVSRFQRDVADTSKYAIMGAEDANRKMDETMFTAARRKNTKRLTEVERMVAKGEKLLYTDPGAAISQLRKAQARLREIMRTLSINEKVRKSLFRTQMLLARSYLDNGNEPKAREVISDTIRTFGDDEEEVTYERYHPRLVQLYRDVLRQLADQRTGKLTVTSVPPGADIYLNGRIQPHRTPYTYTDLYHGRYHVQVRNKVLESMVHKVKVDTRDTALSVDLRYEQALALRGGRLALRFGSRKELAKDVVDFASKVGRQLHVDFIAAAGLMPAGDRAELVGFLIDVKAGALVRSESRTVNPDVLSTARIRNMASGLVGVELAGGGEDPGPWYKQWPGWALIGGGAVSLVVSLVYVGKFNDSKKCAGDSTGNTCPALADRKTAFDDAGGQKTIAWATGIIGGAAIVGGVVYFILHESGRPEEEVGARGTALPLPGGLDLRPQISPSGGSLGLGLNF